MFIVETVGSFQDDRRQQVKEKQVRSELGENCKYGKINTRLEMI